MKLGIFCFETHLQLLLYRFKRHRRNNCRTEKNQQCTNDECNAIIDLVTKAANGYCNWDRFRNRCMLVLEKGIEFEIDKNNGSVKMVEKMDPDN